jgi:hypothetical protein
MTTKARLAVIAPRPNVPLTTLGAPDLWSAGRHLAQHWRNMAAARWPAVERAASVEAIVRLRPRAAAEAAARYVWLLSVEIDEALVRCLGPEPDSDPRRTRRVQLALSATLGAWSRRADGEPTPETRVLADASKQIEALLIQWP